MALMLFWLPSHLAHGFQTASCATLTLFNHGIDGWFRVDCHLLPTPIPYAE
ncbi:uncharacterized protein RSE6_02715 [Rhynchosporium secalis]|uniref:Uncharacterized protein n=1 Tax=Rhynchosporium secalis TaxID=38038 RepID=A0A1E1M0X5_RHYSE|nr:uncharacterized protein RSE6_02715 [Rhynchosporium secalis]